MADEPWDEMMGPTNSKEMQRMLRSSDEDDPIIPETSSAGRMPSRWAQYETDSEKLRHDAHEANCKAVELASERIANSPPRLTSTPALPSNASYDSSDDGSADYHWEDPASDAAIRAEALKMLEIADDHLSTPYSVRKTQSGGFSASYSGGFGGSRRSSTNGARRVPSALAGLDFTKRSSSRASYTSSPRSGYSTNDDVVPPYAEEESLVDVIETEYNGSTRPTKESKWSSRYSIDHTLLALSGAGRSRSTDVKDVLNHMERETDREIKSARNMFMSSTRDAPRIFGSGGFSFRDTHVFGKQNVVTAATSYDSSTNLKTAWRDLDSEGKSLTPPEPRKTWQEQLERKKKQQRRLAIVSTVLCIIVALLIGIFVSRSRNSETSASANAVQGNERTPDCVFYVTSDAPYDTSQEEKLTADLAALPSDADFLVHLGNIQDSAITLCPEARYAHVKDLLAKSPVPIFVLPGEEDWNNCPNPDDAWTSWETNFGSFESNFDHGFTVKRQLRRKENFAFLHMEALFMGFHIVGGRINDQDEWTQRLEDDVTWMESMVTMFSGNFKQIVMLGNARPGPEQRHFFGHLAEFLGPYEMPIIYIHANSGVGGIMEYDLFGDDDIIKGLQIEDGGQNPPLRISIYSGDEAPFVVG
jgi:hypothetical protein